MTIGNGCRTAGERHRNGSAAITPIGRLPKSWFNDFVDRALRRYGKVYIIQPYREQEICAQACQEAQGHECQCSCMGANHGIGNDGNWFEVSDAFSTRWGERELACRLLTARSWPYSWSGALPTACGRRRCARPGPSAHWSK